jgi:hypothetical protein
MPYNLVATTDFFKAQRRVTTLISFAEQQSLKNNDVNRNLFLKLGVVLLVTRFQVYVEDALEEFNYELTKTNKQNSLLPLNLRLTAIKLLAEAKSIQKELENPTTYNVTKFEKIQSIVLLLGDYCNDGNSINQAFKINTQFPLGKQGLGEVKTLFRQINGRDIFERVKFDINKLNEILNRRHNIIHEDANMQLTEVTLREYRDFITKVVRHIDRYISRFLI